MKTILVLFALFLLAISTHAEQQLIIIAPNDSIGYTVQNAPKTDFKIVLKTGIEQQASMTNIALNTVVIRSNGLYRPGYPFMLTVNVDYADSVAEATLATKLTGATLEQAVILGIANYCTNRNILTTQDTMTVFSVNVDTGGLTWIRGFKKQ